MKPDTPDEEWDDFLNQQLLGEYMTALVYDQMNDAEIADHVVNQYGPEKMREFLATGYDLLENGLPWKTILQSVRNCGETEQCVREWFESYLALIEKAIAEVEAKGDDPR